MSMDSEKLRFTIICERSMGRKWVFDVEVADNAEASRRAAQMRGYDDVSMAWCELSPATSEEVDVLARLDMLQVASRAYADLPRDHRRPAREMLRAMREAIPAGLPEMAEGYYLGVTNNEALGMCSYGLYGPDSRDGYIGHFGHRMWLENADGTDRLGKLRAQREQVAVLTAQRPHVLASAEVAVAA